MTYDEWLGKIKHRLGENAKPTHHIRWGRHLRGTWLFQMWTGERMKAIWVPVLSEHISKSPELNESYEEFLTDSTDG